MSIVALHRNVAIGQFNVYARRRAWRRWGREDSGGGRKLGCLIAGCGFRRFHITHREQCSNNGWSLVFFRRRMITCSRPW